MSYSYGQPMNNKKDSTFMSAIERFQTYHKNDSACFTKSDLNDLDALITCTHQLLGAAYRGQMNDMRHWPAFDHARDLCKKLEKKYNDHQVQKKWQEELIRQHKYSPDQPRVPAGNPDGGQWTDAGRVARPPTGDGTQKPSLGERIWQETFGSKPAAADELQKPARVLRPPKQLSTSKDGIQKLIGHEGFKPHVYPDTAGNPTIGYGHLIKPGESFPNGISEAHARELLQQDLHAAENTVRNNVRVDLTQPQFDALTSFAYNVKPSAFRQSTLLHLLNQGDYNGAADEFQRWNKITDPKTGAKVPDQGLTNRRKRESDLFRSGII